MRPSLRQSILRSSEERGILVGRPELSTLGLGAAGAALWREGARHSGPILVGVSGGVDSVLLLHALVAAATQGRPAADGRDSPSPVPELICVHVHHGVRGAAADADATFVARLASSLGVESVRLDVDPRRIWKNGIASEGRLRAERYRLFGELADARGAGSVFVAHHRNDRVEGLVLAAARGAGLRGLSGMPRRRPLRAGDSAGPWIVRPWFDVPRATLRSIAMECGITWREDATNAELQARRNRVRHVVLPRLRAELGPEFDDRLLDLARRARWLLRRLRRGAAAAAGSASDAIHAHVERLAGQPIRKHASLRIQRLVLSRASGAVDVGRDVRIRVVDGRMDVERPAPRPPPARVAVRSFGGRLAAAVASQDSHALRVRMEVRGFLYLDADRVPGDPSVRTRRPGDRFAWPGLPEPVRLKQLFASHHVPRAEREVRVVLDVAGGVAAVEGFGVASWARVTAATQRVLRVSIRRSDDAPHARPHDPALPCRPWEPQRCSSPSSHSC